MACRRPRRQLAPVPRPGVLHLGSGRAGGGSPLPLDPGAAFAGAAPGPGRMGALQRADAQPRPGLVPAAPGARGGDSAAAELRLPWQPAGTGRTAEPGPAAGPARPRQRRRQGHRCGVGPTARGGLLDPGAPTTVPIRPLALEARAARLVTQSPGLEGPVVWPGQLGVCAAQRLALAGPPGPGPQRRAHPFLGLVVAPDPAQLPPGGPALVRGLSLHGLGGDQPTAGPATGLETGGVAAGIERRLGRAPAGRWLCRNPALGIGLGPGEQRQAEQLPAAVDHRRGRDRLVAL